MMSRLSILFLVSAFFLSFTPVAGNCAEDCNSGITTGNGSADALCNEHDFLLPSRSSENNQKQISDNGDLFSGYPETFIIPKGVCERNRAVMEIKKKNLP